MKFVVAADHAGFELKTDVLRAMGAIPTPAEEAGEAAEARADAEASAEAGNGASSKATQKALDRGKSKPSRKG